MSDDERELAHQLAHELRGPLMGIKGLAATATSMYDRLTDEERREFFSLIDSEAERLAKVADQAAVLLLLQADEVRYLPDHCSLRDIAAASADGDPRIQIQIAGTVEPFADPRRLGEILGTLLDNARRYSDGPVALTAATDGDRMTLTVTDDGPGLTDDQRPHAFDRFANVRPRGYEDQPGAGLGLYLARAHAQAMGGDLTMMPAPQGGTIMTLTLPLEG